MVKFLIVRFSSIGDIILTTPVIRHLKHQVDGACIHYLTKTAYAPLLESNPHVDQVHRFDGDMKAAFDAMGRLYEQVRHFEERFQEEHHLTLHFDAEAVDQILQEALDLEVPALSVCQNLAKDLEHALKLVRDRTSQDSFLLTKEAIEDLDAYLNQVIRDYYQKTLFRE